MPILTKAVQTRSINVSLLVDFICDIITTGKEIREHYQCNLQNLQQSRSQLNEADGNIERLINGISSCNDSFQKLNVRLLQQNVVVAEKSLINQKLRSEIANQQKKLESYKREEQEAQEEAQKRTSGEHKFQTMKHIREEKGFAFWCSHLQELLIARGKLELQLYKVNHDIEVIYEETSEKEKKLENIKTMRQDLRIEHDKSVEKLQAACRSLGERKKKLLSLSILDQQAINLSGLYADPKEFSRLQQEFNRLKNKQNLIELQIEEQKQEEGYLQSNMTELMRKQHEFERIIRKQNGDDRIGAPTSRPLFRRHNLGGPNMWFESPILTIDQLRSFLDKKYEKHGSPSEQPCAITERDSSPSHKVVVANKYIHEKEEKLVMSSI